jgi:hypothetical protein
MATGKHVSIDARALTRHPALEADREEAVVLACEDTDRDRRPGIEVARRCEDRIAGRTANPAAMASTQATTT